MPLDIPDGATCFIDANIFYYHFVELAPFSNACTGFLERLALGKIVGYTSSHIVSEAVHKIMLVEAAAKLGLSRTGLVNWLQRHRDKIGELSEFREAARELAILALVTHPIELKIFEEGAANSSKFGLLTNDALVVALMQKHGISNLMTNDDDFDGVTGITVWKPR